MTSRTLKARDEKLMPGFKASKDRLTILIRTNAAGNSKLKSMLIYHSENSTAPKNSAKSTLPMLYQWNKKGWMTAHVFTTWVTKYFKPTVENYCSESKKD